jgi:hypothetical protein
MRAAFSTGNPLVEGCCIQSSLFYYRYMVPLGAGNPAPKGITHYKFDISFRLTMPLSVST